jgi:hypothetical protein
VSKKHNQRTRAVILAGRKNLALNVEFKRIQVQPVEYRSKYTPHIGAKEQERAKRCYMDWTHGNDGALRSAPIMGQMSKATHEAYLEAREQEYESVF